ncbi:21291_t:CDS:2 [Gigaspora margarita]|uniref:21291_t:CDS:1 n=1 Tax=Gigaspora margarita TaxID=4874 RepID=A0ABN7V1S8_GIGMA|nr:21291_t:CDS:2 [Gigaspora margarita]
MSLAIENHCNIDYECLNTLIEVAENLQKEFKSVGFKLVGQKEIVNDLRILPNCFVFERITLLLKFKYNRGAANKIMKYFNNYIYKENPEYKKRLKQLLLLTGSDQLRRASNIQQESTLCEFYININPYEKFDPYGSLCFSHFYKSEQNYSLLTLTRKSLRQHNKKRIVTKKDFDEATEFSKALR